ncbi:MAG: glycosyltransferase family 9 protein [bacterium]|nr:glycosyltransferase family 9 protein [bacterium]
MTEATYEDGFGPLARRRERVRRAVRWTTRGLLGRSRTILAEIRWRLGDEIMAIPVYESLKTRYPASHLAVWCTFPDLLVGNPFVDSVNAEVAAPDKYILLRRAPRDVYRPAHYARLAGIDGPDGPPRLHYASWETPLLGLLPGAPEGRVAVCTGATWPTKRWPMDRWRTLCRAMEDAGHAVVQIGLGDDVAGVGLNLVDRTTVREAACVLRACSLLVCCDSGLMHLARAVGTPAVALFGPTDPAILIRNDAGLDVLTVGAECEGCWNRRAKAFSQGDCPEGRPAEECMARIDVDTVLSRVLNRSERR